MVSASFAVEIPELRAFAQKWGVQADRQLMNELSTGFHEGGKIIQHEGNVLIKGGESSRLAQASKVTTTVGGRTIATTVDWSGARSATGFPYAGSVADGRKAFGPVNAKVLHFVIDGNEIFTMHVRAFPGTHFHTRGLAAGKPKAIARIHAGVDRWAAGMNT